MKKLFLMVAFAGMVGSVSASVVKTTGDGDKDKGKKECKKDGEKSCCKGNANGKSCSADKKTAGTGKKSCCKDKMAAETKPETTK